MTRQLCRCSQCRRHDFGRDFFLWPGLTTSLQIGAILPFVVVSDEGSIKISIHMAEVKVLVQNYNSTEQLKLVTSMTGKSGVHYFASELLIFT